MYYFSDVADLSLSFRSDNSDQFLEIPSHNQRREVLKSVSDTNRNSKTRSWQQNN